MRRFLIFSTLVVLPACGSLSFPTIPGGPAQDCAVLSKSTWRIGPFPIPSENELRLAVGDSRAVFLDPFVDSQCAGSIVSVSWSTDNPSVASVTPKNPAYNGSWITGVNSGPGTVNARILFSNGSAQQATPRAFIVAPLAPPSGAVVATGSVDLDPSGPTSSRYIPFALPQDASQIDMTIDWTSVLNTVDFVLYQGSCSGSSLCGGLQFIALPTVTGVKPIRKSTRNLSAGPYTIRIDNTGPGAETVRYEVRLTP